MSSNLPSMSLSPLRVRNAQYTTHQCTGTQRTTLISNAPTHQDTTVFHDSPSTPCALRTRPPAIAFLKYQKADGRRKLEEQTRT